MKSSSTVLCKKTCKMHLFRVFHQLFILHIWLRGILLISWEEHLEIFKLTHPCLRIIAQGIFSSRLPRTCMRQLFLCHQLCQLIFHFLIPLLIFSEPPDTNWIIRERSKLLKSSSVLLVDHQLPSMSVQNFWIATGSGISHLKIQSNHLAVRAWLETFRVRLACEEWPNMWEADEKAHYSLRLWNPTQFVQG